MNSTSNDRRRVKGGRRRRVALTSRKGPPGAPGRAFTFFLPRSQTFLSHPPEALDLRNMELAINV